MNKQIFRKILIVFFVLILIERLIAIEYSVFWSYKNLGSIAVPILMIAAMVLSINHVKKQGEN